jgi:trans-2,3-dihydro-3-hydroxyanthranilate isomerase
MPQLDFFLVDVFTSEPLAGNPLAVVAGADRLDEPTMRGLAREFNQSETTFVMRPTRPDADWRLRFFTTTGAEVYGAGHNALGAWWWLAASGRLTLGAELTTFRQEIGDHVLPVEIMSEGGHLRAVGMIQSPPVLGAVAHDLAALAAALGIREGDLAGGVLVPQVVSTGAAHLLVGVRDRAAVARVAPAVEPLVAILRGLGGQGCYVFCLDPIDPSATAHARFFNPSVGISEDAATGSAAGPLGCYLTARGLVAPGATLVVEQGYTMERPSRIEVAVSGDRVRVSGSAVVVAEGVIRC